METNSTSAIPALSETPGAANPETVTKIVEETAKLPSAKHSDIRYPRKVQPVILRWTALKWAKFHSYMDAWICGYGGECAESERGQYGGYVGTKEGILCTGWKVCK